MIADTPAPPSNRPAQRLATFLRILIVLASVLVISGSLYILSIFILEPEHGEELTIGLAPPLYFSALDADQRIYPDETYASIFGVAHNSGDTINSTVEAMVYGADIVEVDVVALGGELYSAHTPPLPFLGPRWFRGPTLNRVLTVAYQADAIKLDLKETSPEFTRLVISFLEDHMSERQIIVASGDSAVLHTIREAVPDVTLLLSIGNQAALDDFRVNPGLQERVDGVTIRHSLVDRDTAVWLTEQDLLIFTWTVNNLDRANELIGWGIDGITSDNLAILNLLGGQARQERDVPLSTPETSSEEPD